MLLKPSILMFSIIFAICAVGGVFAQSNAPVSTNADWIRVRSDDGAFSVEVPAAYTYVFNKEGFLVGGPDNSYSLTNMSILNSYDAGTLISFETYDGFGGAMNIILDSDAGRDSVQSKSEIKRAGYKIKQIISKNDDYYAVRQYIRSDSKIYILTAATRTGESESVRRFLDSVVFVPGQHAQNVIDGIPFSKLKKTEVELEMKLDTDKPPKKLPSSVPKPTPDPNIESLRIVSKPYSSYVEPARIKRVEGTIRLKITMAENGSIPKIAVVRTLPEGLLRQAIFAALRIKFLPKEVNEKPVRVIATFDYGFGIH